MSRSGFAIPGLVAVLLVTACNDSVASRSFGPTDAASLNDGPGRPGADNRGTTFDESSTSWAAQHGIRSWRDMLVPGPGIPVVIEFGCLGV